MAEGDAIFRLARRLDEALGGSTVWARSPGERRPQGLPISELDGRRLDAVESRGKHLLLRFGGGLLLHSHLGMRGAWHLYRAGQRWRKAPRSAWLVLVDGGIEAVNFNGTTLRLVRETELLRDPRLSRLGPDLLGPGFTRERGVTALRSIPGERELGDALIDQSVLAGAGNIFKSEGCFAARLSPWRQVRELSDEDLALVVLETAALMRAAAESGRQPRDVYRRSGQPCLRCGSIVRSRGQGDANRTTYWCERCQR